LRISVVIPCYNAERYLAEALTSVERQTRKVFETVVVDDGSTDGSVEVARRFGVRCILSPRRAGPAAARNRAIAAAEGDVIAFLDADDVWTPNHCELVAGLLEAHPTADVAFSRFRTFGDGEMLSSADFPAGVVYDAFRSLLAHNYVAQATAVVRRAALNDIGGFREHAEIAFAEDYDLWLRMARHHAFVGVNDVTVRYRLHPGQRWKRRAEVVHGTWRARHDAWRDLGATPDFDTFGAQLRDVWDRELRRAWINTDAALFDALLAQQALVPAGAETAAVWMARRRRFWPAWTAVSAVVRALPFGAASRLRRLIGPV
jgi:glycosyltransferase involved in cell wall biosynthesis